MNKWFSAIIEILYLWGVTGVTGVTGQNESKNS